MVTVKPSFCYMTCPQIVGNAVCYFSNLGGIVRFKFPNHLQNFLKNPWSYHDHGMFGMSGEKNGGYQDLRASFPFFSVRMPNKIHRLTSQGPHTPLSVNSVRQWLISQHDLCLGRGLLIPLLCSEIVSDNDSISYLMGVCWIMTQDNMQGVKKALREEADRTYKMAVVPEGILCGVPPKSSQDLAFQCVLFIGMNI